MGAKLGIDDVGGVSEQAQAVKSEDGRVYQVSYRAKIRESLCAK
jgi:hypothetical protein